MTGTGNFPDALPVPFFAVATRGLEAVSLRECAGLPLVSLPATAYRRITGTCPPEGLPDLLRLRTVDDVFLQVAGWDAISHTRQALTRFQMDSAALELRPVLDLLRLVRPVPPFPLFSVTVNFVGKRNYSAPEVKAVVAAGLRETYPRWQYTDDDETADLNLRVFIEHDQAVVGVRLAARPLYRRAYKQAHLPGSLKPTAAAALLHLAGLASGAALLDPFAGSGTILIEAAAIGLRAAGGDLQPDALDQTRQNAANAGVRLHLARLDARQLPYPTGSFDGIVTNLPWGRQIQVDGALTDLYRRSLLELRRVVRPGGVIVCLTGVPDLVTGTDAGLMVLEQREISLFGQNPMLFRLAGE